MPGPSTPAPATTASRSPERKAAAPATATLVWIDGKLAILARWDGEPTILRFWADIPKRHRSVGHVHRDPGVRHGGGGPVEDHMERVRAERERAFLAEVEAAIAASDDLVIIGPGVIHEHLAHRMLEHDRQHRRGRTIRSEHSDNLTEHQIVARLRTIVGADPPRGRRPSGRTATGRPGTRRPGPGTVGGGKARAIRPRDLPPPIDDWDTDEDGSGLSP